jgi:hypothetical protein
MQLPVEPIATAVGYGAQSRTTCSLTATTTACESMTTITDDQSVPYDEHRDVDDDGPAIIMSKEIIVPYGDEEYVDSSVLEGASRHSAEYRHDHVDQRSGDDRFISDLDKDLPDLQVISRMKKIDRDEDERSIDSHITGEEEFDMDKWDDGALAGGSPVLDTTEPLDPNGIDRDGGMMDPPCTQPQRIDSQEIEEIEGPLFPDGGEQSLTPEAIADSVSAAGEAEGVGDTQEDLLLVIPLHLMLLPAVYPLLARLKMSGTRFRMNFPKLLVMRLSLNNTILPHRKSRI